MEIKVKAMRPRNLGLERKDKQCFQGLYLEGNLPLGVISHCPQLVWRWSRQTIFGPNTQIPKSVSPDYGGKNPSITLLLGN